MAPKQKKVVGECPICKETFYSRSELQAHMEDPPNHPPAVDLDEKSTGSFGEVSSDYSEDEFEIPKPQIILDPIARLQRRREGEAIGILYCPTCDHLYGNIPAFERHFMFSSKHGEEPADVRNLHYRLWRKSWEDAAAAKAATAAPTSISDPEPMEGVLTDADEEVPLHTEEVPIPPHPLPEDLESH